MSKFTVYGPRGTAPVAALIFAYGCVSLVWRILGVLL